MSDGTILELSSSLSVSNNIAIVGSGSATIAIGANSPTLSGIISGAGSDLTKTGSGTLTLSGASTYSGGTTLSAGQITLGHNTGLGTGSLSMSDSTTLALSSSTSASNAVAIADSGTGTFNVSSGTATLSGVISGTDSVFTKTGNGSLNLSTSTSTYSGQTNVSAGTLTVTGNIASSSAIVVSSGATLKGTGTVPAATILGGIQPGTSIGEITVDGNLSLENGSTLTIEVSPSAISKVIVNGTMTIDAGAKLVINPQAGDYQSIEHVFLEGDSFVGGQRFEDTNITINDTDFFGTLSYEISYTENQGQLILFGMLIGIPPFTTTDTAMVDLATDLTTRINRAQIGLIAEVQNQRFMQRELCCFAPQVCFIEEDDQNADNDAEHSIRSCNSEEIIHPYVLVDYSRATIRQRQYMLPGKDYVRMILTGLDFYISDDCTLGLGFGYTNGYGSSSEGGDGYGHLTSNGYNITSYFQGRVKGNIFIDGAVNWGKNYYSSKRSWTLFSSGKYHGYDFTSQLRLLYQSYFEKVNYRPYLGATYYLQEINNYVERERHNSQLKVGINRYNFLELETGLALWAPFTLGYWSITPQLTLAYVRGFYRNPHDVKTTFVVADNDDLSIRIANITPQQLKIQTGLSIHYLHCSEFFVNYEKIYDKAYDSFQEFRVGLQIGF